MKATVIQGLALLCAAVGVVLWFSGYSNIGLGTVIGGYLVYVIIRVVPRIRKISQPGKNDFLGKKSKSPAATPTWESMRKNAIEALDRKIRGHKLDVNSFFHPEHAKHPALVRAKKDISEDAGELILKTDYEALKLGESEERTDELLKEIGDRVETIEELELELERLRAQAQP